ncbi:alpha/beta fold hydrolase [Alteromonas gracilis]|uniref:alpha/beta fold hydrolase n=1 Tax=Alteromonas gracilis TaxID=1479524 RepID=UPI0037356544
MKLNYKLSKRDSSAPWLVLIHGLFGNADNLAVIKRHFESSFNVVSIDLPDHGESPWTNTFSVHDAAESVFNLLQSLEIKTSAILGHSLGGKVAMRLALNHGDIVSHLIVADIAPVAYAHSHQTIFVGLKSVPLDAIKSRKDAEKEMAAHVKEPGVRQFLLKSLYQDENGAWKWRFNVDGLIASYSHIIDWEQTNQSFDGVTLFIKGSESDYITSAHRDEITRYFPKAKAHIIEGTGHWLHAEKPAAFNAIVERTLKKTL